MKIENIARHSPLFVLVQYLNEIRLFRDEERMERTHFSVGLNVPCTPMERKQLCLVVVFPFVAPSTHFETKLNKLLHLISIYGYNQSISCAMHKTQSVCVRIMYRDL